MSSNRASMRLRKLKLFFACLLMAVLSIGQVWANKTIVFTVGAENSSTAATINTTSSDDVATLSVSACYARQYGMWMSSNNNAATATLTMKTAGQVKATKIVTTLAGTMSKAISIQVTYTDNSTSTKTALGTATGDTAYALDPTKTIKSIQYTAASKSKASISQLVIHEASGSSEPTLSLKQGNVEIETLAIPVAGATNQTLTVAYANIKSGTTPGAPTLAYYSNAACTSTTSKPSWLTSVTATNGTTITYSAAANTTDAARTPVWMVVSNTVKNTSNANATVTDTLKITQAAPTGTFVKFTGATIPNGYYVICSGTSTIAMKSKATSAPRLENATVTIANSKTITNPDDSVVWKLENLTGTDAGYFTLYNEETEKYAAFTSANGNATLLAEVTNYAKFKHTANTSYDFENKGKTGKVLRYNSGYGFASYSTGTGAVLTLYKKALPFALTINSSIANGSVGASDGSTAISSGSNVLSGTEVTLSNTPADGYKLTAYDIYKTGESATKVTVTNGKFTMPDYAVTVSASFEAAKTLSSISLSGTHRTEFWQGEAFNSTGLVVTAHYDDNSSATVTPTSVSSPTMTSAGEKTITVSYTEGGATKEETYDITVKALPTEANPGSVADMIDIYNKLGNTSNMYVIGTIYKINGFYSEKYISYWITDSYDADEEPNHTNEFELYNGLDFEGHDFTAQTDLETGQEVVVKGNLTRFGSTAPYTYEFGANNIIISRPKVLKSIALSGSYPTAFTQGDEFSSEGLVVTASYNYGDPTGVTPTSITGYNMSATGNQTVTVSYTEGGVTKTATYGISVAAPDLCEHKATISKGAEVNGTFSLSVSGEQCLDELEGYKTSTVLTATPAEHYHLSEVTATVGTVGVISENSCTISNITANTTITAVFAEDDKVTIKFDKGTESATGVVPTDVADKYAGQSVTLPANPFTYTGSPIKVFGGWKHSLTNEVKQPGSYTITAADAAEDNITFTAVWNDLSPWATVYTSNIALAVDENDTKAYAEKVKITVEEVLTEFPALRAATGSAAGTCHVIVPAGTQTLHFHAAAWNAKTSKVTVKMGETTLLSPDLTSDAGIANTSPYTLSGNAYEYYYSIDLSSYSLTEDTRITFSAGSDKRFVLFGVNQEGGSVPVLDHIEITGTMTNTTGWKTGDNIIPEGLTVTAYYTQNDAPHHNTEVTDDVTWSHAALVENQTEVTLTASYTDGVEKTANTNVTIDAVETGDPTIITDPTTQATFTATERGAALPAAKTIAVTLKNITSATATLGGTNPDVFSLSKTTGIVDGDEISVSVVSTDIEVASYSATVTIKDASGDTQKSINIYLTIKQPEAVETPVSTSTKWVPATAITNGMQVLITGAIDDDIYAMGAQGGNNRTAVKGSVDGDIFTPSDGTMAFTLIAQEGGTYAIQTSAGKYLYAGASNNNRLYTRDAISDDNNANWTVAIGALEANGSNRGVMQFNSGLFNCYASASQSPIKLYVQAYTVTFNSNEGSAVAPVNVAHGQTVAQPANPTKDNYTFVKWQLNGEDYNFATPVTAAITLDAVWTPVMYTVTFNSNGGSDVASANVAYGETVAEPTAPTREGYTFNYWTLNEVEYDFDTPVTDDITLVANWTEDTPTPVYTEVRTGLTAGRHYTVCLEKNVTAVKGATFWSLTYKNEGGTIAYLEEETAPFAEGKPYIIQATDDNEGKLEVIYGTETAVSPVANGVLRGTFSYLSASQLNTINDEGENDVYMLFNNELRPIGTNNHLDAHRAYVLYNLLQEVPTAGFAPGKRVKGMPMQPQVTTDIDNVQGDNVQCTKVLIDGQMYILRGEKLYDATGRLVK